MFLFQDWLKFSPNLYSSFAQTYPKSNFFSQENTERILNFILSSDAEKFLFNCEKVCTFCIFCFLTLGNEFSGKVLRALRAVANWMLYDFVVVFDDQTCNPIEPNHSAKTLEKDLPLSVSHFQMFTLSRSITNWW